MKVFNSMHLRMDEVVQSTICTSNSSCALFCAIPEPMLPAPMTATLWTGCMTLANQIHLIRICSSLFNRFTTKNCKFDSTFWRILLKKNALSARLIPDLALLNPFLAMNQSWNLSQQPKQIYRPEANMNLLASIHCGQANQHIKQHPALFRAPAWTKPRGTTHNNWYGNTQSACVATASLLHPRLTPVGAEYVVRQSQH